MSNILAEELIFLGRSYWNNGVRPCFFVKPFAHSKVRLVTVLTHEKESWNEDMIPLSVIQEMFEYNYWARDLQLRACATLTPEQSLRPLGSSFSSIQGTIAHLLRTEWVWLERWRCRSTTKREAAEFAGEKFLNLSAIEERWRTVERDVREYLAGLNEERLTKPLSYANLDGESFTYPLWRTLFHVINHQTYHRGQVTTMLRQVGIQPPQIDFLVAHDLQFKM